VYNVTLDLHFLPVDKVDAMMVEKSGVQKELLFGVETSGFLCLLHVFFFLEAAFVNKLWRLIMETLSFYLFFPCNLFPFDSK